jgi:hypothetical protein
MAAEVVGVGGRRPGLEPRRQVDAVASRRAAAAHASEGERRLGRRPRKARQDNCLA